MTEAHRQSQLEVARQEMAAAKSAAESLRAKKGRFTPAVRDAYETYEFWSNKVSFLANVKLA